MLIARVLIADSLTIPARTSFEQEQTNRTKECDELDVIDITGQCDGLEKLGTTRPLALDELRAVCRR
jgi:hypothetical protein